jgi:SRSO17 transposase
MVLSHFIEESHELSTTHFGLWTNSFNSPKKLVKAVNALEMKKYGQAIFVHGQAINLEIRVFACWARKHPRNGAQSHWEWAVFTHSRSWS